MTTLNDLVLVVERGINVSSGIVTFLSRKEFTFTALYLDLFCYVQFVVKQDESSLPSSSSQLHIPSRRNSQHSPTLACLRARPKLPCCAVYKFIFFCHSLQRWERKAWKYQARDSHEKQINGPEGPPEGTFSRKPKIFSLPLRNGMKRLIEIFLLYILCSLTKISV